MKNKSIKTIAAFAISIVVFSSCQPAPLKPLTLTYNRNGVCSDVKLTNKSNYNLSFDQTAPAVNNSFGIVPNESHSLPSSLSRYQYTVGVGGLVASDQYSLKLGIQCLPTKPEVEVTLTTGQSLTVTEDAAQPTGLVLTVTQ